MPSKNMLTLFAFFITTININAQACGNFELQFSFRLLNLKHPYKIKIKDFEHARFHFTNSTWFVSKNQNVEILWRSSLGNPRINSEIIQSFKTIKHFTIFIEAIIDGQEYLIEKRIRSADYIITTYVNEFPNKIKLTIEPTELNFLGF